VLKIWKLVFFSFQAEGRGFSRTSTGSTPTSSPDYFGTFFIKKLKISAPKINQKPVQNSEFDDLGFLNLKITGYRGLLIMGSLVRAQEGAKQKAADFNSCGFFY
jgi:hypothetical protein